MDFNSSANFTKARIDVNYNLAWQAEVIALTYWQIQTPQRKARYSDKQRIRLKDAKSWALSRLGCQNAAEVKKYLKILGIKLDLRLTSAWVAINKQFAFAIKILRSRQKEKCDYKVKKIGDAKD